MNSLVRATPDMKANGAERTPFPLAQSDALSAATRGGTIAREQPVASGALDDIVAARMKDLTDRLAAQKAVSVDTPLTHADVEIQPVSLAAISALRELPIADAADDSWLPAPPMAVIAHSAPSQRADGAVAIAPPASPAANESTSERNLKSLLAVLDPPAPLRLTSEPSPSPLTPTIPAVHPLAETFDAGSSPAPDEPLLLADQSGTDIRLVDLIKRQQSLLDQLNSYPPAPVTVDTPADPPAAPAAASLPVWSVVDQLAPTVPVPAIEQRTPSAEAPPPLPSSGDLRLAGPSSDDTQPLLPERSPMIIERARAARSGHHGADDMAASPSPLPAFAAGIAIAVAIAGSLFFVL